MNDIAFDDIGPQRIYHFYEPRSAMRAVLVVDHTQFRNAAGGVRMLPDISLGEMTLLARAMTYKFAWLDLNAAGAKEHPVHAASQDREAVLRAFGQAPRPSSSREPTCAAWTWERPSRTSRPSGRRPAWSRRRGRWPTNAWAA